MTADRIVVVGASAGGMDALTRLVAQLPAGLPAAVFIVNHMSADTTGEALLRVIDEASALDASQPTDGQAFQEGHIYLARSDQHMLIGRGKVMITKGAMENRSRPGIDPLFRSAAVAYGNRVIGVLLTGYLDDGTAGLSAIQRCGGVTIVQDPDDAAYPDMPRNALEQVKIDHCVPLAEMGALLAGLLDRKLGKSPKIPKDVKIEAKIAERVLSDLASVEALGDQVPFNCPGCGGVLWEISQGSSLRYRCHTGHAFTAPVLLAEQSAKIEETLWIALRMFEERRNLLTTMAKYGAASRGRTTSSSAQERAKQSEVHIERIRSLLRQGTDPTRGGKEESKAPARASRGEGRSPPRKKAARRGGRSP